MLQMTIDHLRAVGVQRLVLVVGYRQEEVISEAEARVGSMNLHVIENPRFREGAILSLWSAREFFNDDLLIMDADVFSPQVMLHRLVGSVSKNCVLVDGSSADTGEEQVVLGKSSRVLHITKRPSQEMKASMTVFGESVGFLKLSREAAGVLSEILDAKVREGEVSIEHEQVYPELFSRVVVGYERVDNLPWTEIDTPEDLKRAETEILPRWRSIPTVNRFLSNLFLPVVLRLPLTPNQWTFLSLIAGVSAVVFMAAGDRYSCFWGAFLFQVFYVIDNWDGDVARSKGLSSRWGGWFDVTVDGIVQISLPVAMALGLHNSGAPAWVYGLGWISSLGIALDFMATGLAKIRGFGPSVSGDPSRNKTPSGSVFSGWVRANATHENFSLVVVAVLLLDLRFLFLVATALGTHLFWIRYSWVQRSRLFRCAPEA